MKAGRNDPCPCGSGKKYKKCCLEKNLKMSAKEERKHEEKESILSPGTAPESTPEDPRTKALNERWEEFEKADSEGRIAIYLKTLEEKELMDDEMAFEMLNIIYDEAIEKNQRDRFDKLVDKLQEQLPDIYEKDASYYLSWKITHAVLTDCHDVVSSLLNELAPKAGDNIDTFNNVVNMLAYHGFLSPLVEAMQAAWPFVESSAEIVPWGIDEFATRTEDYIIFNYIEARSKSNDHDPELIKNLKRYTTVINHSTLSKFVDYISGNTTSQWVLDDFDLTSRQKDGVQNLYYLTLEFLSTLRKEEGVPFTKGELAREQLFEYFIKRYEGELEPKPSLLEQTFRPQKRKPKKRTRPKHILCPDSTTLDVFLVRLLHFLNPQHYKVAATVELIPAWLRFLESRHLIDESLRAETRCAVLTKIVSPLSKLWKDYTPDPTLHRELARSWESDV